MAPTEESDHHLADHLVLTDDDLATIINNLLGIALEFFGIHKYASCGEIPHISFILPYPTVFARVNAIFQLVPMVKVRSMSSLAFSLIADIICTSA
jgi:hypothetical protein